MKDYRLSDLLDMSLIQKLAYSNFLATGLPMSIIDAFDTSILVRAGWTDICLQFHRAYPLSNKRCLESDDAVKDHLADGGFYKYRCKNGLWHVAIPIIVAKRHLATMFLTQFYFEGEVPEREYFIRQASEFGYDREKYLAALDRLPVFSVEKVDYILAYDKAFVRFISDLAEQSIRIIESEEAIRRLNEELEQRVIERTRQLESTNVELKLAQSRILQQEKMASIGQLAAGVAHEINNPMGFIISNLSSLERYVSKIADFMNLQSEAVAKLALQEGMNRSQIVDDIVEQKKAMKLDFIMGDLSHLIKESLDGADRVKKIVQDLKTFSRLDDFESKRANINDGLDSTITIAWNELKYKATIKKEYGDIPAVMCNLGQLNQVFMNILLNAAQAIPAQGVITVRTWSDNSNIHISISDTGNGIKADKINRIFEPFFTTKDVGQGTGLGLSIAYDIIKKHSGDIRVESKVGQGSTFTIVIPIVEG